MEGRFRRPAAWNRPTGALDRRCSGRFNEVRFFPSGTSFILGRGKGTPLGGRPFTERRPARLHRVTSDGHTRPSDVTPDMVAPLGRWFFAASQRTVATRFFLVATVLSDKMFGQGRAAPECRSAMFSALPPASDVRMNVSMGTGGARCGSAS